MLFARLLIITGVCLAIPVASAIAQTYPSRNITIVVPFPPGGGSDVVPRRQRRDVIVPDSTVTVPIPSRPLVGSTSHASRISMSEGVL